MPDILIRMEMPKSCADCPFEVLGDCNGGKVKFIMDVDDYTSERAPRCPLHELPPHGDLIDRRELLSTVMQVVTKFPTNNIAAIEHLDLVSALLRGATVVVPAERRNHK